MNVFIGLTQLFRITKGKRFLKLILNSLGSEYVTVEKS